VLQDQLDGLDLLLELTSVVEGGKVFVDVGNRAFAQLEGEPFFVGIAKCPSAFIAFLAISNHR
jgi:hypothetical protein